jgi:hypothetical protein
MLNTLDSRILSGVRGQQQVSDSSLAILVGDILASDPAFAAIKEQSERVAVMRTPVGRNPDGTKLETADERTWRLLSSGEGKLNPQASVVGFDIFPEGDNISEKTLGKVRVGVTNPGAFEPRTGFLPAPGMVLNDLNEQQRKDFPSYLKHGLMANARTVLKEWAKNPENLRNSQRVKPQVTPRYNNVNIGEYQRIVDIVNRNGGAAFNFRTPSEIQKQVIENEIIPLLTRSQEQIDFSFRDANTSKDTFSSPSIQHMRQLVEETP